MNDLPNKIEVYLGRKPDFKEEIILQNDDGTDYIKEWNATDKPKPTDEQLDALSSEATTLENNALVRAKRKAEYGSVAEQLEYIVEHGVSAFIEKQNAIKTKYPKENE
tara:strand:- start:389 stop:712 length:324 start_codon:yes stop_codon:yes gene_type:complete